MIGYGYDLPRENSLKSYDGVNYLVKVAEDEFNLMYMGRPTWPGCPRLVEPLNRIASEKGIAIHYLNTEEEKPVYLSLSDRFGFKGVPAVFITRNGELVDYLYSDEWLSKLFNDNRTEINEEVIDEFIDKYIKK